MSNLGNPSAKELFDNVHAAQRARTLQEHATRLDETDRRSKAAYTVAHAFSNLRERLEQSGSTDTLTMTNAGARAQEYTAHADAAALQATEQRMQIDGHTNLIVQDQVIQLPEQKTNAVLQQKH